MSWTLQRLSVYTEGMLRQPLPVRRFIIEDTSMHPTLLPGDRVLVFRWARPCAGDVVVAQDPERHLGHVVKRVAGVDPNGDLDLRGDNPNVSRDSRHFGSVPRRLVVGRVIYRYLPGARRGRLSSRG